jgi:uncharacterized protein (DUF302 family)
MIHYGFIKRLDIPYETVIKPVREALKKEGFGVLTEADIDGKMKEKLGLDMRKFIILGVCNPTDVYESIPTEETVGHMLPLSVIVYEKGRKTVLSAILPMVALQGNDNAKLQKAAEVIEGQLKRVFAATK